MRSTLLLCALVLGAPLALAQDLTVERDGTSVTITRPDGATEQFTIGEDVPLRVHSENGPLIVEDGTERRHFELRRDGEAPRAFAFSADEPHHIFRKMFDLDSLAHELDGMHWLSRDAGDLAFEHLLPGLRMRGVDPETRRGIAEGERESRELARRLRGADGAERDRLEAELRQTLERTFDLKQQARRERAERMRQEAERRHDEAEALQSERAEREAARWDIIERRERELLGEPGALEW